MMTALEHTGVSEAMPRLQSPIRVLLAAGGTGGHVYPAISIADAVMSLNKDSSVLFVGTRDRMEWQAVPNAGYTIRSVWISGFHRRLTPQNLLFPVKLMVSLVQSLKILKRFKPDVVISCGGFAAGPVGWMATKLGIPLVIQEQNSFPGVTNRILARRADKIFTAFDEAEKYLPKEKITQTGNPVRSNLILGDRDQALSHFGFTNKKPVLLLLGGSGGALALNKAMKENLSRLHNESGIQIIWQCGPKYYEELKSELDETQYPGLKLIGYIDSMEAAYSAADLVLTRAGAGTCSELMLTGKPSLLVPSPNVAGDHQTKNAGAMVSAGASVLIPEKDLNNQMADRIESLIFDEDELSRMSKAAQNLARPDAANEIAEELFKLVSKQL